MTPGAHIPPGATRYGPGMYADADGELHIDLDEFVRETGGDPSSPRDVAVAEAALREVCAERGIDLINRAY